MMDVFHIGDHIEIIVGPDKVKFDGILTDWDDVAIYVNGLGFPREDILAMSPIEYGSSG